MERPFLTYKVEAQSRKEWVKRVNPYNHTLQPRCHMSESQQETFQ